MENTFYFENGLTPDWRISGRPALNWNELESVLNVHLVPRDRQVTISGSDESVQRAMQFFAELSNLHELRKRELDRQDVEQLIKAYSRSEEADLQKLFAGRIKVGSRKREILPRSRNQLEYLKETH